MIQLNILFTKTSIKLWINFEKAHRVVKLNQNTWLKPYIDMNTKLRKKAKNNFEKYFFKLMDIDAINDAIFKKAIEILRKYRAINIVTTEEKRTYLISEPNHHITKFFYGKSIGYRNDKNSNTNN